MNEPRMDLEHRGHGCRLSLFPTCSGATLLVQIDRLHSRRQAIRLNALRPLSSKGMMSLHRPFAALLLCSLLVAACGNDAMDESVPPQGNATTEGGPGNRDGGDASDADAPDAALPPAPPDADAPDAAPPPALDEECAATRNSDGWCWASANHPMNDLESLLSFANDDVWATSGSALVHWNGQAWTPKLFVSDVEFEALWASSPTNVLAVGHRPNAQTEYGEGVLYRFDGQTWKLAATYKRPLAALWGSSATDVWVGTMFGKALLRWNGKALVEVVAPSQFETGSAHVAMDGTSGKDVWVIGTPDGGTKAVQHFDGSAWSYVTGPFINGNQLKAVRAFSSKDVWVGGAAEQLYHFDGVSWRTFALPKVHGVIVSITGKPNDVTFALTRNGSKNRAEDVALLHYDGDALSSVPLPEDGERFKPQLSALSTTPSGALLVSRGAGDVYSRINGAYTRLTSGPQIDFRSASSTASGRIVAGGVSGNIAIFEKGKWTSKVGVTDGSTLTGVLVFDSALFAAGDRRFVSFTAKGPEVTAPFDEPDTTYPYEPMLYGTSPDDLWVASRRGIWRRQGGTWATVDFSGIPYLSGAFVTSKKTLYAWTDKGALWRHDGGSWVKAWSTPVQLLTEAADGSLLAVSAAPPYGKSAIVRDNATIPIADTDIAMASAAVSSLTACKDGRIYGLSPAFSEIVAFEGGTWTLEQTGVSGLHTLHCDAQGTVWALGDDGVILKKL